MAQGKSSSESQVILDNINSWSIANDMQLNPNKCKKMIISFSSACDFPPALSIGEVPFEGVECHEVLGLTLRSNLKWNIFIAYITSKASKRLHILCALLKIYVFLR